MCSGIAQGPGGAKRRGGGGGGGGEGGSGVGRWLCRAGGLLQVLFPSLVRTCQAGGQGVMWKCGRLASTWLSLRTCLCREETPGLITPSPDTLLLLLCCLPLFFSPYLFFLSFSLSSLSSAAAPSHSSHSKTEGRVFFPLLPPSFFFFFFFFADFGFFSSFFFPALLAPCV